MTTIRTHSQVILIYMEILVVVFHRQHTQYQLETDGMYLDDTDDELYVIIRYKGDQSPVTGITLSYS